MVSEPGVLHHEYNCEGQLRMLASIFMKVARNPWEAGAREQHVELFSEAEVAWARQNYEHLAKFHGRVIDHGRRPDTQPPETMCGEKDDPDPGYSYLSFAPCWTRSNCEKCLVSMGRRP